MNSDCCLLSDAGRVEYRNNLQHHIDRISKNSNLSHQPSHNGDDTANCSPPSSSSVSHYSTSKRRPSTRRRLKKGNAYSITERRVSGLIPVLGSQPARDVSHKPGGRLPLFSARPAVTLATLKRAATDFAAW